LKVTFSISATLMRATIRNGNRKNASSHKYGTPITAVRPVASERRRCSMLIALRR
jgi:hypothetical protein